MRLNLIEAAFVCGVNPIRIRRMIARGELVAEREAHGAKWTYYIDEAELARSAELTMQPARLTAVGSDPTHHLTRLDALERRIAEIEALRVNDAPDTTPHAAQRAGVTIDECCQLARAHGIGYWSARDWRWLAADRTSAASALAYIHMQAPARFKPCQDESCGCHAETN